MDEPNRPYEPSNADLLVQKLDNFLVWQKSLLIEQITRQEEITKGWSDEQRAILKQLNEQRIKEFETARVNILETDNAVAFNLLQANMAAAPPGLLRALLNPNTTPLEKFNAMREITSGPDGRQGILAQAPDLEDFVREEDQIKLARYMECFATLTCNHMVDFSEDEEASNSETDEEATQLDEVHSS